MTKIQKILILVVTFASLSESIVKIGISKSQNTSVTQPSTTTNTVTETTQSSTTTTELPSKKDLEPTATATHSTTTTMTTSLITEKPQNIEINSENSSSKDQTESMKKIHSSKYYCKCDLSKYFCDLNCCCDIDCNNDELKTFTCTEEKTTLYDFKYQQGLPYCKVDNGWLCIFRENNNLKPVEVFNKDLLKSRKGWAEPIPLATETIIYDKNRDFYKYDDEILVYNEITEEISEFGLPYPIFGSRCFIQAAIRFLVDTKRECLMDLEKSKNITVNLFRKFNNSRIVRHRSRLDEIPSEKCNLNDSCVPFHIKACWEDETNNLECKNLTETILEEMSSENSDYLAKIYLNIIHNYSDFVSVQVEFILRKSVELDVDVWQTFEVAYSHQKKTDFVSTSGDLGYIFAGPIILGKMVPFNESEEQPDRSLIIDYFHENQTKYRKNRHIYLPGTTKAGKCTQEHFNILNYAENSFQYCDLNSDQQAKLNASSNFTEICVDLQKKIFKFLLNRDDFRMSEEILISKYGNPRNESEAWVKIEWQKLEGNPIVGILSTETKENFICHNIILHLEMKFLTYRTTIDQIEHQHLINEVNFVFGTRLDLQFELNEEIIVPIYYSVVFFDLTDLQLISATNNIRLLPQLICLAIVLNFFNF